LPEVSGIEQNYPNPFNSATTIAYHVVESSAVRLEIYDISGQRVRELVHGHRPTGSYRAVWDGADERGRAVSSGVYFYALRAGSAREIKKMLYVK
jgi:flagellar hook assembly protein FlgD